MTVRTNGQDTMATTGTFQTGGLHCSSCSMLITMAVEELDGVQAVACNHVTGETVVMFDQDAVSAEGIRAAIQGAGYTAELVN